MSRTAIFAALFVGVASFSGCMHEPKLVPDKTGGYVAIPENTNTWPHYYRDEAYKKIREAYPYFNPDPSSGDIVREGVVPVGSVAPGTPANSVKTEYQIAYRVNPKYINNGSTNSQVVPAGGMPPRNFNGQPSPVGGPALGLNPPTQSSNAPFGMRNFDSGMAPTGQSSYPGNQTSYPGNQTSYPGNQPSYPRNNFTAPGNNSGSGIYGSGGPYIK